MGYNKGIDVMSGNGLKVFLPLLYFAKKMLKICVYHNVIGGELASYAIRNPKCVKYLKSFDANWVEFSKMVKDLGDIGITNCDVVPNFKELDTKHALKTVSENGKCKFCMFSRVMAEKGISDAIEAVSNYNSGHEQKIKLEIWGPVEDRYKDEFYEYVSYMGCADFNKSVESITDNIALLFPTYWRGEGFPGTIIDAYSAAVPVIATDWNANSEIIRNFETGWVYPNDKVKNLEESIAYAVEHYDEMISMRKNCSLMATRYTSDFVMRRIIEKYLKN